MGDNERIPQEVLDAATLRLCRKFALCILSGMTETGATFEELDAVIGVKRGHTRRYFYSLVNGTTHDMDTLAHVAYAMGYEIEITAQHVPQLPKAVVP